MTQTALLSRAATALGLAVTVLASCAQPTTPVTPEPPVTPPADAPTALVYGVAGGPVYEKLEEGVKMTVHDGSQDVTDFDMVIFDGDGFSPEQIGEDALVREAIYGNVWVLGLDVKEAHKEVGLGDLLHSSSEGDTDAYLVRQEKDAQGRPGSRLIEFVNPEQEAEYQADRIVRYIKEELIPQQVPNGNIPARAVTYYVHHATDYSGPLPNTNNPVFNGTTGQDLGLGQANNPQHMSWTVDHQVSLFLDAYTKPFGDFQHVLVDLIGEANPGPLALNNRDDASGNANMSETAWFQTRFGASTSVPEESGLILTKTSPENTNNTTSVTSGGYQFNVGFSQDSGVGANFAYTSPTKTTTISDWQAINASGDTAAGWDFASNTVYNGMNIGPYDGDNWFYYFEGVVPQGPNTLSLNAFEYDTESYWINNQVYDGTVQITGTDSAYYTDAWVVQYQYDNDPKGNYHYCLYGCDFDQFDPRGGPDPLQLVQHLASYNDAQPWALTVDMSAVIPVPTKSLTFSYQGQPVTSVTAGNTVQAILTLASPTPVPAEVKVKSGTSGITPENDSYIIPANSDTLTFNILTGAEGCEPQSATIQAFYADGQNASLTVDPPPNCQ